MDTSANKFTESGMKNMDPKFKELHTRLYNMVRRANNLNDAVHSSAGIREFNRSNDNDSALREKLKTQYTNGTKTSNAVESTDLNDCVITLNIPPGYYGKKRKAAEEDAVLRKKYRNKYNYLDADYITRQRESHSSYYCRQMPEQKMVIDTYKP